MIITNKAEKFLTVAEVSALLHVHPNTLRRWVDEGKIFAYRINDRRDRRFKPSDVTAFIDQFNADHVNKVR